MAIIERVPETTSVPATDLLSEEYVPKAMPPILGTWDMTTTFIVSIYLASGQPPLPLAVLLPLRTYYWVH